METSFSKLQPVSYRSYFIKFFSTSHDPYGKSVHCKLCWSSYLDLGCTFTCLHDAEPQVAQYLSNCVVKTHWMPSRKMKVKSGDLSE